MRGVPVSVVLLVLMAVGIVLLALPHISHRVRARRIKENPGLKEALEAEREEGRGLLAALDPVSVSMRRYERQTQPSDVETWTAKVERLLCDQPDLARLLRYSPPRRNIDVVSAAIRHGFGSGSQRARLREMLRQLDWIIERL